MNIEFLPHTADIRMKIQADTLQQLFTTGMNGMGQVLKEGICDGELPHDLKQIITVSAQDLTCLLVDFLSEVLSFSYTEKAIFCELVLLEFSEQLLSAEISGMHVNGFSEEIKAVTYHEADVKQNPAGLWETVIVFDI